MLADEAFDLAEQDETDAIVESIGFRVAQLRDASPWRAFRFRFPWLLATIGSGLVCAVLAGWFEATLAQSLILAFFLALCTASFLGLTVPAVLHALKLDPKVAAGPLALALTDISTLLFYLSLAALLL